MESFLPDLLKSYVYFLCYLFIPGFLTALSINIKFKSILSYIVCGFCLSLFLSQLFALICVLLGLKLSHAIYPLCLYCILLATFKFKTIRYSYKLTHCADLIYILPVCLVFLLIMIFNGGLLDELSDAWWHMSYANKISETNSIFLDRHHLSGIQVTSMQAYFKYPPGWHMILALIHQSSGLALTTIWHNIASFLVPVSLMSYFLFAKVLTRNSLIAITSIVLFCITFGGLNSYFRVSPWPGNVSYILWYFLYYLAFRALNHFQQENHLDDPGFFRFIAWLFTKNSQLLIIGIICCYLILSIHASELLWFVVSFAFYFLIATLFASESNLVSNDLNILKLPVVFILILTAVTFLYNVRYQLNPDLLLTAMVFIITFILGIIFTRHFNKNQKTATCLSVMILISIFFVFANVDQIQFLFNPIKTLLNPNGYHYPVDTEGFFGNTLLLPQWEHQLREGILLSGLVSLFISFYLALKHDNRACLFLFGNCFFAILALCSPHLFTFLNQFTPNTSTYRVQLLIFHPIILAYLICFLIDRNLKKCKLCLSI